MSETTVTVCHCCATVQCAALGCPRCTAPNLDAVNTMNEPSLFSKQHDLPFHWLVSWGHPISSNSDATQWGTVHTPNSASCNHVVHPGSPVLRDTGQRPCWCVHLLFSAAG